VNAQKEAQGILFRNDKKSNAKHPDYRGSATLCGVEYWVSGWIKEGQRGKFMSLAFTDKADQREGASAARDRDSDIKF
jgi:hypothetical protein